MRPGQQRFSDLRGKLGIREDVEARAIKAILADRLRGGMHEQGLTKTAMAAHMGTSRRALDRLLGDFADTCDRAAKVLGGRLHLELVDSLECRL